MTFVEKNPPATEEQIKSIEDALNLKLPPDYKAFLLETNGGVVDYETHSIYIKDFDDYINIEPFYSIDAPNNLNIMQWNEFCKEDLLPNTLLIGDTIQHGFIVLITEGEDSGVYYWDDTRTFETSSDDFNMYFLAPTFSEFVELMENKTK